MSVCACDGEMRGGWREEGVLVSLKSLTHRIGMTSLPKKPGSLLLLFRSQTHSLLFSPFFPSGLQELLSVGGFQHNHFQNQPQLSPFCSTQSTSFPFILLYMQICINAGLSHQQTHTVHVIAGTQCVVNVCSMHRLTDQKP